MTAMSLFGLLVVGINGISGNRVELSNVAVYRINLLVVCHGTLVVEVIILSIELTVGLGEVFTGAVVMGCSHV